MMVKVFEIVLEDECIWFVLVVYNMGYVYMFDVRLLMVKIKGNLDSWIDVK